MDGDLDDLLDEIEEKFVIKKSASSKPAPKKLTSAATKKKSDIDDDIDSILDVDLDVPDCKSKSKSMISAASANDAKHVKGEASKRCFPVCLGGSSVVMGLSTSVNKKACDQLRCTSCDFRVCTFDNYIWSKDTDYLFLRNNVPDFKKLSAKLKSKKGFRAYCCQCQWRNISDLMELRDPNLSWVCGKHQI